MDYFYVLRAAASFAAVSASAYTDHKTGLIPDKITYSAGALGIVLLLASMNLQSIIEGVLFAGLVYAFGYALYYFGQLGGGDVKLFVALSLLMPYKNAFGVPFSLMVLLTASFLAVFAGFAYYGAKYLLTVDKKDVRKGNAVLGMALLLASSLYVQLISGTGLFNYNGVVATYAILAVASFYTAFGEDLNNKLFARKVSTSKIREEDLGDVIAVGLMGKKDLEKLGLGGKKVLDEEALEKMKAKKLKFVWLYSNLPRFGPAIFLATIIVLWNPEWPLLFFTP